METSSQTQMTRRAAVRIDSHAAATLRYIRSSMDSAGSVVVPGSTAAVAGAFGLSAAALCSIPQLRDAWLVVWIVAALVTVTIGGMLLLRHSPSGAITIAGSPIRKFVLCFAPPVLAGAILTAALWRHAAPQLIPGTWLVLYGCAHVSASVATRAQLAVTGTAFLVLGLVAFVTPVEWHMILLALGFGATHLLLAYLIASAERARAIAAD